MSIRMDLAVRFNVIVVVVVVVISFVTLFFFWNLWCLLSVCVRTTNANAVEIGKMEMFDVARLPIH